MLIANTVVRKGVHWETCAGDACEGESLSGKSVVCVLSIRYTAEADGQNRSVAPFLGFFKVNIKIIAQDCYLTNFPNTSVQILPWELLLFKL